MNNLPVYLDYAATTPVDPQVAAKMSQYLTRDGVFANPASRSHRLGWIAEEAVEEARQSVAQLVKADSREIVWTSGATEANNLAIKGIAYQHQHKGRHLISSVIEHKAVIDTLTFLQTQGFEVTWLKPDNRGVIHPDQVHSALREETILVSLMHVNNEIGSINDLAAIGAICRHSGVYFHVDAAQSFGKLPIDLSTLPVDLMSFSAHKIYGPKGIGALYVRQQPRIYLQAQIHGGGHERGMRSGTLPTHQIVAMGEAAKIAAENMQHEHTKLLQLRQQFLKHIQGIESVSLNASTADHTQQHPDNLPSCSHLFPGIMNVSVAGVDGEVLLMALGDIAVSTGSACNSASLAPSYVLKGIGLSDELALSSLRISIGRYTTEQEIDQAAMQFCEVVTTLTRQNNSAPVTFSL